MPSIKITRMYTLPHSREGGTPRVELLTWDPDDYRDPVEWASEELSNAGCVRHNRGNEWITEEPKITSFARGEEMTATARLDDFTPEQLTLITRQLGD